MKKHSSFLGCAVIAVVLAGVARIEAQQVTGVPGSPSATTTISGKQLPPRTLKFGGVIKEKATDSKPWWPPTVVPPKGAPNVLLDHDRRLRLRLAEHLWRRHPDAGLGSHREGRAAVHAVPFHALCSPTRAALITGRNHHVAGFGVVGEAATGFPGYDSVIRKECGTIGEILKENGYATSWFGKDHNTPFYQSSAAGPFDQWPVGMGFEYFYGFVGGDTSQWQPNLFRNTTAIYPFQGNPGWNLTTAMADDAIQYMKQTQRSCAGEAVLRLLRARRGPFAASSHQGMDQEDQRYAPVRRWLEQAPRYDLRQPEAPRHHPAGRQAHALAEGIAAVGFAELGTRRSSSSSRPTCSGAYLAYTDHEIGRVIQAVEDMGKLNDTLIMYISGDNGASAEGMLRTGRRTSSPPSTASTVPVKDQFLFYEFWGSDLTFPHYAVGWAWAFDTPFQWTKQVASHFGGTAPGHVHVLARPYQGRGRHPHPVPPCH